MDKMNLNDNPEKNLIVFNSQIKLNKYLKIFRNYFLTSSSFNILNQNNRNEEGNNYSNLYDINSPPPLSNSNQNYNISSSNSSSYGSINKQEQKKTSYHIAKPRDYQLKIFNKIEDKNAIVFLETGKGKTFISIMLIEKLLNLVHSSQKEKTNTEALGKKTVFLVCEVALVEQQSLVISSNTPLKVKACSGKNMKSMKKNVETFRANWESFDVFVATPMVIYQLLSTGYLKISDIDLLIFDECHHTDSNHPYNLLMNEFYFFYKTADIKIDIKLPQIIGLTASPLKKKITKDIESEAIKAMKGICENLDCVMIIDPEVKDYKEKEGNDGIYNLSEDEAKREYIAVIPHTMSNNFDQLRDNLFEFLLNPLTKLCFEKLTDPDVKLLKDEYGKYLIDKFNCTHFLDFAKVLSTYKYLYELRKKNGLLNLFEKLQRHLFMIMENIDLNSILDMLIEYRVILLNCLSSCEKCEITDDFGEFEDFTDRNVKLFIEIINGGINKISAIMKSPKDGYYYESDRINKLKTSIFKILEEDLKNPETEGHRIIIFVSNRIVAESLSKIVNQMLTTLSNNNNNYGKKFLAVSVVGVSKKKAENALNPKNSVTKLNENIEKFKNGVAQILIGTSTVEEGLDVKSCDVVIVYTELRTAKSYIQMKGRARKVNAKFLVFTPNVGKTIESIENFVNLTICMRNLFNDDILKDFRGKNFLHEKKLNYHHLFVQKTHAKITLKNVAPLYNEFIQILSANCKAKGVKSKTTFKENREFIGLGMTTVFTAILNFTCTFNGRGFPIEMTQIVSDGYTDKSSAENHCFVDFFIYAHKLGFVDNHFKLLLK